MYLTIVYGTRPEFLKLKILIEQLRKSKINFEVIKIIQHENLIEDDGYFDEKIEIVNLSEMRFSNIGCTILSKLPKYIENSTHILTQGDTATAFYGLLCAFQMGKKCIHLEAGMRTYDLKNPFPEEGFRQMISRITDIHLCPSESEKKILETEKVKGEIFVVGNTILDLVESYNFEVKFENLIIITLHRRENWSNYKDYIIGLIELSERYKNFKFFFIIHPNPIFQAIIKEISHGDNIFFLDSILHVEMISLLSKCKCVITDSGGIQEEANFLGKHIFILRQVTERNSISKNRITFCNKNNISTIDLNDIFDTKAGLEYGDGNSCTNIINILKNL